MRQGRLSPIAEPITSARSHARDRHLAQHPQGERRGARVVIAARLRQIAPGHDAEFRGQPCSRIAIRFDSRMTESSAYPKRERREIGGPVAGIHVPPATR